MSILCTSQKSELPSPVRCDLNILPLSMRACLPACLQMQWSSVSSIHLSSWLGMIMCVTFLTDSSVLGTLYCKNTQYSFPAATRYSPEAVACLTLRYRDQFVSRDFSGEEIDIVKVFWIFKHYCRIRRLWSSSSLRWHTINSLNIVYQALLRIMVEDDKLSMTRYKPLQPCNSSHTYIHTYNSFVMTMQRIAPSWQKSWSDSCKEA